MYVEQGRFQTLRCHCSLDFLKALAVCERVFAERERAARENESLTPDPTPPDDVSTGGRGGGAEGVRPPGGCRRLLLVDNVAAFYWLDRASRAEQGAPLSLRAVHHASAARLMELSRRCRAPIIVTKATTSSESSGGDRARQPGQLDAGFTRGIRRGVVPPERAREHRDFLPQQWTSAVTQRLVLDVERTDPTSTPAAAAGRRGSEATVAQRFEGAGGTASFRRAVGAAAWRPGRGTSSAIAGYSADRLG